MKGDGLGKEPLLHKLCSDLGFSSTSGLIGSSAYSRNWECARPGTSILMENLILVCHELNLAASAVQLPVQIWQINFQCSHNKADKGWDLFLALTRSDQVQRHHFPPGGCLSSGFSQHGFAQ